ncbi:hypothetical protein BCD48_40090 [Pseudofrankia sp. BMG5.36]|nr:hypothetical protein BCD48_40090 [Pseudofrankia sp. BMG5.36]
MVEQALGSHRRRAIRATSRLGQQLDQGRNVDALTALLQVVAAGGPASTEAYRKLDTACADPAFLDRLARHWVTSRRIPDDHSVTILRLLLGPAQLTMHTPSIRLIKCLDSWGGVDRGRADGLVFGGRRAPLWVKENVARKVCRHSWWSPPVDASVLEDLQAALSATDHPDLLTAMAREWADSQEATGLADAILANPHIPAEPRDDIILAVLRDRMDLVDRSRAQTVDMLLDLTANRNRELAARCSAMLRGLAPGAARDRLCHLALRRGDARRIVDEQGWYPDAERDRLVFFLLTGGLDRVIEMDPGGQRLLAAYHSLPFEMRTMIGDRIAYLLLSADGDRFAEVDPDGELFLTARSTFRFAKRPTLDRIVALFLAGELTRVTRVDPGGELLRAAYVGADTGQRRRIREAVRDLIRQTGEYSSTDGGDRAAVDRLRADVARRFIQDSAAPRPRRPSARDDDREMPNDAWFDSWVSNDPDFGDPDLDGGFGHHDRPDQHGGSGHHDGSDFGDLDRGGPD